jgi:hypothetical protein
LKKKFQHPWPSPTIFYPPSSSSVLCTGNKLKVLKKYNACPVQTSLTITMLGMELRKNVFKHKENKLYNHFSIYLHWNNQLQLEFCRKSANKSPVNLQRKRQLQAKAWSGRGSSPAWGVLPELDDKLLAYFFWWMIVSCGWLQAICGRPCTFMTIYLKGIPVVVPGLSVVQLQDSCSNDLQVRR